MDGLAATSAGVTNTYGDGSGNTVTHHYAGTMNKPKRTTKTKKKRKTNKGKKL